MTDEGVAGLERSRHELAAARLLADNGFPAQAISRAYYAAFYAAEAALLGIGEVRSKHAGVIAAAHPADEPTAATGVRDLANNVLSANQGDGTTVFTIGLTSTPLSPWTTDLVKAAV